MTAAAATYYVAPPPPAGIGNDANPGTITSPFATITKAMDVVYAGDTVNIRGGTYRETVFVRPNRATESQRITVQPYENGGVPEDVVIKASEIVTGWTPYGTNAVIWIKTNWAVNSQQVFVHDSPSFSQTDDGVWLQQIGMPGYSYPPEYYVPYGTGLADMTNSGCFYYDSANKALYVRLPDDSDPNLRGIEASYRERLVTGRDGNYTPPVVGYFNFRNLRFRHSNITARMEQWPAVNAGLGSSYESCDIQWCDFGGLVLNEGVATNCNLSNNGNSGGGGSGTFTRCTITNNNYRNFVSFWHAGGLKNASHTLPASTVEFCNVSGNRGPGIWYDSCISGEPIIIRNNFVSNNEKEAGIFVEISTNALIYNNIVIGNERRGIYSSTSAGVRIYNNLVSGSHDAVCGAIDVSGGARPGSNMRSTNNSVVNNIIYNNQSVQDLLLINNGVDCFNNVADYNCFYRADGSFHVNGYTSLAAWSQASGLDTHSFNTNPRFLLGAGTDFRLTQTSPLIDRGQFLSAVSSDWIGVPRPQNTTHDIGPFEFDPESELRLWIKADEGQGNTAYDETIYQNDGANYGATWVEGRVGPTALGFNGTNSYVRCANSQSLNLTNTITIMGWFLFDSSATHTCLGIDKSQTYRLVAYTNGVTSFWSFQFMDPNLNWHYAASPTAYANNTWHHVAGTYDGTNLVLYVDGLVCTTVPYTGTIRSTGNALEIGRRDYSFLYKGKIDHVKIYGRPLTAAEIYKEYASADLVAWYPMNESAGSIAYDQSSNQNNGTIAGATWAMGRVGNGALQFNGSSAYVQHPHNASLNITNSITILGWFLFESGAVDTCVGIDKAQTYRLVGYRNGNAVNWSMEFLAPSMIWYTASSPTTFAMDTWHHVAGTYDGANLVLYVDGQVCSTIPYAGTIRTTTTPLEIGRRDGSRYFKGSIDNVKVYNRALSASEIAHEFQFE